ncbi:MAG: DUF4982 domain-containing protein [Bacteroidales bacterium]|nr:DUF4982 domain-containing protein [Candidatus Liminaster caballi]
MKTFLTLILSALAAVGLAQNTETLLLSGWRFQKGHCEGAEQTGFDDSRWQQVSIPHDWAISGPFDKDIDKQVVAIEQNGEKEATEKTGRSGSLPWIGEGWYRTEIEIPEGYGHAELIFDGAMAEPHVYLDGVEVGFWAYGYNTFCLDITGNLPAERSMRGFILPGRHTLAVHLNNREESSRWYPGAGLYRPVRLLLGQRTGLKTWGTFARTTMISGVSADAQMAKNARITVSSEVRDMQKGRRMNIVHILRNAEGGIVSKQEAEVNSSQMVTNVLPLANAQLWSPEHPVLYTLETQLTEKGHVIESQLTKVGIRTAEYDTEGFKLNGQVRKFKGVCLHHDLGPLGSAFNKDAFRRQVRLLKEIGCDAIRTSHNMPAPWQMDICDEMGMLVMAESCDMWVSAKCKNGYSVFFNQTNHKSPNANGRPWWERDFENLVLVHRNHPSIVMWSIGNEIPDQGNAIGYRFTVDIQNLIHRLDGTRPCTQGMDRGVAPMQSGVWQATDIPGFNYRLHVYKKGLAQSPKGIVLGSETASTVSSRGVYKFPVKEEHGTAFDDGQISSYDLESCIWSNLPDDDWMYQDKCPWVIGEFVWTGFDYLGEPTPYDEYWPSRSSYFGIYDLAGLPKDRAWLYRTHWATDVPTLHVLPHWTWRGREGEVTPVFCYTNYPEAELFVNGKSQGRKRHTDVSLDDYEKNRVEEPMPWGGTSLFADPNAPEGKNRLDRYRLRWMDVTYEPGEIRVVAYDKDGNAAAEEVIRTAGKPHHIELVADRESMHSVPLSADGKALDCPDLTFVTARVVDKDGNLCPDADNQLSFAVSGTSARFNSCCNGDATSLEVFTNPSMKVFHGQLVIAIEATDKAGTATLKVSGKGLKASTLSIVVGD